MVAFTRVLSIGLFSSVVFAAAAPAATAATRPSDVTSVAKIAATQSSARALVPFTGYYALSSAPGAFVMVATELARQGAPAPALYTATITISLDGKTSHAYTLGQNCTFDAGRLKITGAGGSTVADLNFSQAHGVRSVRGRVGGKPVAATTPFGPIQLSTWSGTYYRQSQSPGPNGTRFSYAPALQIDADGSVKFAADGGALQPVPAYTYDFSMFVIAFVVQGKVHVFEMGTASKWGRVAGDASHGSMLVSLKLNEAIPHL